MTRLTSFAQMAEDIVLWRALRHRTSGFFVDVGAHHPVGSSVTKIFSNAGWRGINIEPIESMLALFFDDRPNDINLAVGISSERGVLEFFDVEGDQQRSTFDPGLAAIYRAEGRAVATRPIPVITLNEVFEEHVSGEVDFLKVDAEGHEEAVLRSLDFSRWRPHVVLGEGPNHMNHEWTRILEAADYRPALFDGVNRFFVASEHFDELGEALSYPACPLDDFETFDHLHRIHMLDLEIARLQAENDRLSDALAARGAAPLRSRISGLLGRR